MCRWSTDWNFEVTENVWLATGTMWKVSSFIYVDNSLWLTLTPNKFNIDSLHNAWPTVKTQYLCTMFGTMRWKSTEKICTAILILKFICGRPSLVSVDVDRWRANTNHNLKLCLFNEIHEFESDVVVYQFLFIYSKPYHVVQILFNFSPICFDLFFFFYK